MPAPNLKGPLRRERMITAIRILHIADNKNSGVNGEIFNYLRGLAADYKKIDAWKFFPNLGPNFLHEPAHRVHVGIMGISPKIKNILTAL